MNITYTKHLKFRLKEREISLKLVREIFDRAEEFYFDSWRKHFILVAKVDFNGKLRKMLVSYDKIGQKIEVITVHPISQKDIKQRIKSKRWINEKIKN
jgi:hypothetical protein